MNIEDQIANLRDPQEFTHLVNIIFSNKWGQDFEQIDDNQADGGNDGYLITTKTLYARHCFKTKEKSKQLSNILTKARSDLSKAKSLRDNRGYSINNWCFVTAYRLPAEAYETIKKEAIENGFAPRFIGPAFLAAELLNNRNLLQEFPWLHINHVDALLTEISKSISEEGVRSVNPDILLKNTQDSPIQLRAVEKTKKIEERDPSEDYKTLMKFFGDSPSESNIRIVKKIINTTRDRTAILQGILILCSWYEYSPSTIDSHLSFIDLGIDTAKYKKALGVESILLAEKAQFLTTRFSLLDLEGWGKIEMTNTIGFPIITPAEKEVYLAKLKQIKSQYSTIFKESIEKVLQSQDSTAIIRVFSTIGSANSRLAGHYLSLGIDATQEIRITRDSFMYAKNIALDLNDEIELAYLYHNFSNALGSIGESSEALDVLDEAIKLAEKHKMNDILAKTEHLTKLINTPKPKLR